jgi:hypothetical protein
MRFSDRIGFHMYACTSEVRPCLLEQKHLAALWQSCAAQETSASKKQQHEVQLFASRIPEIDSHVRRMRKNGTNHPA